MKTKQQRGIALVISLIILLSTTFLSVSVIQQNKLQFLMAGNTRQQTETLSNAENLLALAEEYVKLQRQPAGYDDKQCVVDADGKSTPLSAGDIPLGVANATATIEDCFCNNYDSACASIYGACGSEIYTIRVQFTDSSGAYRAVKSRYSVACEF